MMTHTERGCYGGLVLGFVFLFIIGCCESDRSSRQTQEVEISKTSISGILTEVDLGSLITFTFKDGRIAHFDWDGVQWGKEPLTYQLNVRNTIYYEGSDFESIMIGEPITEEEIPTQDIINQQILDRLTSIESKLEEPNGVQ